MPELLLNWVGFMKLLEGKKLFVKLMKAMPDAYKIEAALEHKPQFKLEIKAMYIHIFRMNCIDRRIKN